MQAAPSIAHEPSQATIEPVPQTPVDKVYDGQIRISVQEMLCQIVDILFAKCGTDFLGHQIDSVYCAVTVEYPPYGSHDPVPPWTVPHLLNELWDRGLQGRLV